MKYIVFCAVFAALIAVSIGDPLYGSEPIELHKHYEAASTSSKPRPSLRRKKPTKIRKKLKDTSAEAAAVAAVESSGDAPADAPADTSAEAAADAPAQGHYFEVNSYKTRTTDVYEFHDYANDKRTEKHFTTRDNLKLTWKENWESMHKPKVTKVGNEQAYTRMALLV